MQKRLLILFFLLLSSIFAKAQKWLPGHFTDHKGVVETGFLRVNPSANGPVKDEGFIEFKEDDKATPFKLSASEIQSFVIGRDSFIVAHPPQNETWIKNEFDFVRVVINADIKLFMAGGGGGGSGAGGKRGVGFSPGISTGIGTGGYYGGGISGGISIPIGGGGGGNGTYDKTAWYYGENTSGMKRITDQNFEDVMSDIMGDYPEVVEKIHARVYMLANMDRLIAYYKQVSAGK